MSGHLTRRSPWRSVVPLTIVAFLAATSIGSAATPAVVRPAQSAIEARLDLVDQRLAVDPNGTIELSYLLTGLTGDPLQLIPPPEPAPPEPLPPEPTVPGSEPVEPVEPPQPPAPPELEQLTLEVINYAPLTDPTDVARLVGGDVDPDAFGLLSDAVDGVAIDARPLLSRNDDGSVDFALDIETDVVNSIGTRLKLEQPGVYPLRVQLLLGDPADNNVVATAGTVVQRIAGAVDTGADPPPPIDLAVVTVVPEPPLDPDQATLDSAGANLDEAVELAAAVDAPITLEVPPTLIADKAATPEGQQRLTDALANDELVAMPIVPLDVSSAVAAGQADTYTLLLEDGEELLTTSLPTTSQRREVWIPTAPLSADGAQHLRDLGAEFVVFSNDLYAETVDDDVPPSDRFVEAELPDGTTLPLLVVDQIAEELTTAAADRILSRSTTTEWAVETLGEFLVAQAVDDSATTSSLAGRRTAPPRRSRLLTTPDLSSPDARLVDALDQLATTTPAIRFTPASTLGGSTDVLLDGSAEPVTVQLPDVAGPPLADRVELIDQVRLELASAASMLPSDDPRLVGWSAELDTLISTGYTDEEAEAIAAMLIADAARLTDAVVLPEPFAFTLTGRRGTIEVRIGNTLDEPLDVIVALDSEKVTFPEGDRQVTLRPLDETTVNVPVEAEANGTSSINLVVTTPAGEPIDDPVTLTARVTAFTGLGQVLTGGFILVLLTWWFTNWRGRRRANLAVDGRDRHPSSRAVESDGL